MRTEPLVRLVDKALSAAKAVREAGQVRPEEWNKLADALLDLRSMLKSGGPDDCGDKP